MPRRPNAERTPAGSASQGGRLDAIDSSGRPGMRPPSSCIVCAGAGVPASVARAATIHTSRRLHPNQLSMPPPTCAIRTQESTHGMILYCKSHVLCRGATDAATRRNRSELEYAGGGQALNRRGRACASSCEVVADRAAVRRNTYRGASGGSTRLCRIGHRRFQSAIQVRRDASEDLDVDRRHSVQRSRWRPWSSANQLSEGVPSSNCRNWTDVYSTRRLVPERRSHQTRQKNQGGPGHALRGASMDHVEPCALAVHPPAQSRRLPCVGTHTSPSVCVNHIRTSATRKPDIALLPQVAWIVGRSLRLCADRIDAGECGGAVRSIGSR